MLKRYKIDLYLKERIMTLRELVTVAHDEFRAMGLSDMERFMAMGETPVLIDVRGCLIGRKLSGAGFIIGDCEDIEV